MRDLNRFKGCLLGGAVGDALGYPIEFFGEQEIYSEFGNPGVSRYKLNDGKALISDDTQMTLFTAIGLLYGQTRMMMQGGGTSFREYIRLAYLDWLDTQTPEYSNERARISWLVNFPTFFQRRAPGRTCISALVSGGHGTLEKPVNCSKGCGGVMRVAPIGLYYCDSRWTLEQTDLIGAQAAAITHGHELGYIPAAALAHIIRILASSEKPDIHFAVLDMLKVIPNLFPYTENINVFLSLIKKAIHLSQKDMRDLDAIHALGEGWVGEETLAIAIYCALKYPKDFEKAVTVAVNHGGDSDSTGSVTGNILGTALGLDAIPAYYLNNLEFREIIEEVAEDLYHDCRITEYGHYKDPVWMSKYIYIDYAPQMREKEALR